MGTSARFGLILMALFAGGIAAAVGLWYVSSGDTTAVLAALIEQTPTPGAQPTPNPTPVSDKKQQKADAAQTRGAFGIVSGITRSTLTVKDAQGQEQTYALETATRFIVVGTRSASAANLSVGDKVLVLGAMDGNTFTARLVVSAPAAYDLKNVLAGRIVSASATSLQVETRDATRQVTLGADAQVLGARLAAVQADSLKAKSPVLIFGEPGNGDQFNGQVVIVLPGGKELQAQRKMTKAEDKLQRKAQKRADKAATKAQRQANKPNRAGKLDRAVLKILPGLASFGTVQTISGNNLTLQPQLAARDFTLDANTKIIVVGKPNATASDIQSGDKILVVGGGQNKNKPPKAVLAAPAIYTIENVALGQITAVNGLQLAIKTRTGDLQVTLGSTTQIFGDGLQTLTANELQVNRAVIVFGTRGANGTMEAQVVFMPPGKK